jgi:hypothetical protein
LAGINPFSELLGGFMSIFSAIDAERDLNIVEKAIADAKKFISERWEPHEELEYQEVVQILDKVLKYCQENITE